MEGAKTQKAVIAAIIAVAMIFPSVFAANITVGGSTGWDLSTNLTLWSSSTQFFVNDSLLFIYTPAHDVIEVREPDIVTCETSSPIAAYNDQNAETLITLTKPGPRYFVCGRSNHCTLGLKMCVQVLDSPGFQPNTSSLSNPATQPDNSTHSDERKEHTPYSSGGFKDAIISECGRLILTVCLFVAMFGADIVTHYWLVMHTGVQLFLGIMLALSFLPSLAGFSWLI